MCYTHIFRLERFATGTRGSLFFYVHYIRSEKSVKANKRRDPVVVLPWWVAALAFVFGALLGAMVAAVLIEDEKELRR